MSVLLIRSQRAETQRIERFWKEGKLWLKRVRRPTSLIQSHSDELSWRLNNAAHPGQLFGAFLEALKITIHVLRSKPSSCNRLLYALVLLPNIRQTFAMVIYFNSIK